MVAIRLSRYGKKNHPTFRVIVSDRQKDTLGKYLEQVGTYNPHANPATVEFNTERINYWLSVGAQPSGTVHNLLVDKGIIQAPKKVLNKAKAEPVAEAPAAPKAEAAPAEKPAEAAPAAEAPKAETAPAEEKPVETATTT
jgi:small subunit ribosomal protein S16